MGTKISALPAAATITGTELVPIVQGGVTAQATSGTVSVVPRTAAEIAASLMPTSYQYQGLEAVDVLRYGIVPNSSAAAAANTTKLQALLNPALTGPLGRVIFPNTTGADVYYFAGVIPVRRGVHIDLMGSTLNNTYTAASGDVNTGFLYSLGDLTVENGFISIAVNTSSASGSGQAIYIGARGAGTYYTVYDSLLANHMGNVLLRNLRITVNNTGTNIGSCYGVVLLGGVQNFIAENVVIAGSGTLPGGVYAEYGWATNPGGTATSQVSHANNLIFRNITVTGLQTSGGNSDYAAIALVSCYNVLVDGLFVYGASNGFEWRIGEDYFYVPWVGVDDVGAKNICTVRNVVMAGITGTGVNFSGAAAITSASYMYSTINGLSGYAKYQAQTDLMTFELDGFVIDAAGAGISVSGPVVIRNGKAYGAASSGQLIITDECVRFSVDGVQLLGSSSNGVRATFGDAIWSPARLKSGSIRNSKICGNTGAGVAIGNSLSVKIEDCQIGYNTTIDGFAETTQTIGVNPLVTSGAYGVVCDGCDVTVASGGTAYSITGTGPAGCDIRHARGAFTTAGTWDINGVGSDTSTNLGSAAAAVNTGDKYYGRQVLNTTTNKLFVAQGSTATSTWISVDGATTITPA